MSGSGFFVGPSQSATVLLHNQGPDVNGVVTFENIAETANVPGAETALSAAFGDINNDGFVDLLFLADFIFTKVDVFGAFVGDRR